MGRRFNRDLPGLIFPAPGHEKIIFTGLNPKKRSSNHDQVRLAGALDVSLEVSGTERAIAGF